MNNLFSLLEAQAQPVGLFGGGILEVAVVWGGMLLLLWFLMIRPQKKKQRETEMMQNSLKVGDAVLTNAGLYGKVVDVVNDVVVVEFGNHRSVAIPVHKSAIISVTEPDMTIHKEEATDTKKTVKSKEKEGK